MEDHLEEIKSLIGQVDFDLNTEEQEIDGRSTITLHQDYGSLFYRLYAIEKMVRKIETTDESGFVIGWSWPRRNAMQPLALATTYYGGMRMFLNGYSCSPVYTLRVDAFYAACEALGMLTDVFMPGEPWEVDGISGRLHADLFNELIVRVRATCRSAEFRARLRYRKENAKRNEMKGIALEAQMYEWKSRHLILRLNLGYQEQYRKSITLDEIQRHRERFFGNRRMNTLLRGITGFIWKLEQGESTGLHLHVLLFYVANSRADVYIAQQIGEYWMNVVTEGKGSYWNSNAEKMKHLWFGHGIGTGMIDRTDTAKREALRKNIRYLAKSDQHLMMKQGVQIKTFRTSRAPNKKKSGRPRVDIA